MILDGSIISHETDQLSIKPHLRDIFFTISWHFVDKLKYLFIIKKQKQWTHTSILKIISCVQESSNREHIVTGGPIFKTC